MIVVSVLLKIKSLVADRIAFEKDGDVSISIKFYILRLHFLWSIYFSCIPLVYLLRLHSFGLHTSYISSFSQ